MKHTPSNLKKISILGGGTLLFIVILNACFGLFRYPLLNVSPFEAIPKHTTFILETEKDADAMLQALTKLIPNDGAITESIVADRDLMTEFFGDIISDSNIKALIAPQMIGAAKIDFLYVFDIRNIKLNPEAFRKRINEFPSRQYNYQGASYQSLQASNGKRLSFYRFRNLILASKYPILIEDGIRQLKDYRSNINFEKDFKKIYAQTDQPNDARLFINFNEIPKALSSFLNFEKRTILKALPHFVSWSSLELNDFSKQSLKGQIVPRQSSTANDKKTSKIYKLDLLDAIPDNTGFLYASQMAPAQVAKDSIFNQFVKPWFFDEWSFSILNPRSSADRLLILKSKEIEYTSHYLERYGRLFGELTNTSYQTFPLIQLADDALLAPFVRSLQLDIENPFYTIVDDLVLFAKNRQGLELVIDKYIVGQTILSNNSFAEYANNLSDQSGAFAYFDGVDMAYLLKSILIEELQPFLENWRNAPGESFAGGLEFYNGKELQSYKANFGQKETNPEQTDIVWRVALPATVSSEPKPLWNPVTGEYEIAVQDNLHNLYLLNDNGEIMWKRALREPLLSEIQSIDYQEDGSRMLFFNTANKIYLIDRKGKDIGNYPLRLQSPATNGMSVVDFKHDLNHKIFLACENGHAYGFTKDGNPVFGWKPKMNIGKVLQPFQHFQYNGKDYLVILNNEGELSTYNSVGESAFPKLALGASYKSSPEILSIDQRKVIALSNDEGQLKIVNSKGDAYNLSLKNSEKEAVKLTFANLNGDTKKDLVALSKNKVTGYYQDKKQLKQHFEVIMNHEQDEVFEVQSLKDQYSYFGTLCKSKKQINLFNAKSTLHKDFPLAGTTPFKIIDLYQNKSNVLIVGLDNTIYAYQIANTN